MTDLPWQPFAAHEELATDAQLGTCVVAIGVFDGVHLGHQALLSAAREDARERGCAFVVVTFDPDPSEVVGAAGPSMRLLGTADRVAGLYAAGADAVVVLPFTTELAHLSPEEFVVQALGSRMAPVSVHVGSNFRFGYRGAGTPETLAQIGARVGCAVHAHDLMAEGGEVVSATRIRGLLAEGGRLDEANRLLGRCHFVRGRVEHGRGEGTSFGFPTANVVCDLRDCLPAEGVYACYVTCGNTAWPAAANVGAPPTFLDARPAFLEANLIGFEGDLYGSEVSVSFVEWLRPSRVFDSLEELEEVVLGNIGWTREHLGESAIRV